jgi:hypothetical protein
MDNSNVDFDSGQESRKSANIIHLLLPARMYEFECSWTTEKPLPAMEEFSCRLLLMLGEIYPNELQNYFGLNNQEKEILLDSLFEKRLAVTNPDGSIKPSSILQSKSVKSGNVVPSLTVFEERQEKAVFDLLSLQLLLKSDYLGVPWGLPEIPSDTELMKVSTDKICEAFSSQYRAHLEKTRRLPEVQKTRLYKIGQCQKKQLLQIPINMIIELEPIRDQEVRVIRNANQKFGENRNYPLSNELEAKIADYLGDLTVSDDGISINDFFDILGDDVLGKYIDNNSFDFSSWLFDRDHKKTGYGNPNTRAILGPVYLKNNTITIVQWLKNLLVNRDEKAKPIYWLPANVPLWAANSTELPNFIAKVDTEYNKFYKSNESFITLFPTSTNDQDYQIRIKSFSKRIPNGVAIYNASPLDRVEVMIFQDVFAIVQYHVQPSKTSGVTIPIGFMTSEPERLAKIETFFRSRLKNVSRCNIMWSKDKHISQDQLLDYKYLEINQKIAPTITYKKSELKKIEGVDI